MRKLSLILRTKNWSIEFNTPNEEFVDDFDDIYERYDFSTVPKHRLPICEYRNEILNALKSNTVVVIEGATGCGKTTQVPQFIIDDCRENGRRCNVIVTQPRRIAAVTNAERISAERKWPPRSIVGYQIGMDERSNYSDDTRLLFCTTGILLEKLIVAKDFLNFTHIIIDEVHERSNLLDLLLIVIKKIFAIAPPSNIKVILMSATIDAQTVGTLSIDFQAKIPNHLLSVCKVFRIAQRRRDDGVPNNQSESIERI